MGIYSEDRELDQFMLKVNEALLLKDIVSLPESFKEINYGVSFKCKKGSDKKVSSVSIYHSDNKGFSIVTANTELKSFIRSLLMDGEVAGSDEAGKGDFFGPLVVCSFLLGEKTKEILSLKFGDSKAMNEKEIFDFYEETRKFRNFFSVVKIMPKRYNSLYNSFAEKGGNLNNILAWAHKKALSDLIEKNPNTEKVIIDQFSSSPAVTSPIREALKNQEVIFQTKGEKNDPVAAASVIARAEYLLSLKKISEELFQNKIELNSGSGPETDRKLLKIIDTFGVEAVESCGKLHFANFSKLNIN